MLIAPTLLLLTLAPGCSSTPAPGTEPASASHHDHEAHADHPDHEAHHDHEAHAAEGALVLTLDGTERWQMDEHTRMVVGEIREALASATLDGPEAIGPLASQLSELETRLISGCTMDGAAHDQLHVFLVAWMPAVEHLAEQTEMAEGQKALAHLRGLIAQYDRYFE